jgi:hypothetical protein
MIHKCFWKIRFGRLTKAKKIDQPLSPLCAENGGYNEMKPFVRLLVIVSSVCAIISACLGVFYSFDGTARTVTNIYGQEISPLMMLYMPRD